MKVKESGITTSVIAIIIVAVIIVAGISAYVVTRPEELPPEDEEEEFKFAAIFPGSIQDADYNTLGVLATTSVGDTFEIPTAYSERVAVPDSGRVMREYADAGYNIIWAHGAQFNAYVLDVAEEYPDVSFILEADFPLEEPPANIWNLDRNFYSGYYALGALAALKTETDKIGYICGVELPFAWGEINSTKQAVDEYNPGCEIIYAYIGDFNDPIKTRIQAEAMIAEGVDVIMSSVNLGNYGLFEAARAAGDVWVTCKYTDKRVMIPELFLTAFIHDFSIPVNYAVERVMAGEEGGYTKIEFGEGEGCYINFPIAHVSEDLEDTIKDICDEIEAGVVPEKNLERPTF